MITNSIDGVLEVSNFYTTNFRVADIVIYTNQLSSNDVANIYAYLTKPEHWWLTPIPAYWIPVATAITAFVICVGIVLRRNGVTTK